jgi:hypothetical protein
MNIQIFNTDNTKYYYKILLLKSSIKYCAERYPSVLYELPDIILFKQVISHQKRDTKRRTLASHTGYEKKEQSKSLTL